MNIQNNIDVYALTDCHQEARRQCCLFTEILSRVSPNSQNTLICDGGDLFKGIYDRQLCVDDYLKLKKLRPNIHIVLGLGNNDFGFNLENFNYLKNTVKIFEESNIHVLCANLIDLETQKQPDWIKPYICLNIDCKKILVTAFCINQVRLQRYGISLTDSVQAFQALEPIIKTTAPDGLIIINHALMPDSQKLFTTAEKLGIDVHLIIGGHEHLAIESDPHKNIYYPQAYNKDMLHLQLNFEHLSSPSVKFVERIECTHCTPDKNLIKPIEDFEQKVGLNVPIARSTFNLEKRYTEPCSIGTFITNHMRDAAQADIGLLSTGYICRPLQYQKDKILTKYDIERSFSSNVPLQIVKADTSVLLSIFNNAVKNRYNPYSNNTRFLQCSDNIKIVCFKDSKNTGKVRQVYINNQPLLTQNGQILDKEKIFSCAIDPFIGAGELGFDAFSSLEKKTLMFEGKTLTIKNIFIKALKDAENEHGETTTYPCFQIIDN